MLRDHLLRQEFLEDLGIQEPALGVMTRLCLNALGLISFFTVGEDEVRAWTGQVNDTAPAAAGVIHSDLQRGFIRAEVIAYDDYVTCNGENGAKGKGLMRVEGKEYVVADGDCMHFRFNV